MILNDPKRAKEVLEYATDRASKGMIDKSLPGYIRSVYESGGELPQAAEEKKRAKVLEKRASEDARAREERLRAAFNEHWKKIGDDFISQLPGEELESSYAQWAAGPGKLLSQKGKKGVENQGFRAHLRVQLQGKPTEQDFQTWAKNQS